MYLAAIVVAALSFLHTNPADLGLTQPPYLGVSCRAPNSTVCGRVGIAVWVKGSASNVEAQIASFKVRLNAPPRGRGQTYWQGFVHLDLKRLGLPDYWLGSKVLNLRLSIRYGSRLEQATLPVTLHPGWG